MKKKELIKRMEGLKNIFGNKPEYVEIDTVIELISELDEPQPVKILQFVADWIEVCKENLTTSLYTAMNPNFMKENNQSFDLILWIKKTSNQELFARAWLDGYEIEEEKRYWVKLKRTSQYLRKDEAGTRFSSLFISDFTRNDIENLGFGWVFDCKGIEIEEVE